MFNPRGYYTHSGYTGFHPDGRRMHFCTLDDYLEYLDQSDSTDL